MCLVLTGRLLLYGAVFGCTVLVDEGGFGCLVVTGRLLLYGGGFGWTVLVDEGGFGCLVVTGRLILYRSEEQTSELQSQFRPSYDVFGLKIQIDNQI